MIETLPSKLKKEPIIDALFEMRFTSATSASSIVPGVLFSKLSGDKTIERLPTEQIPKQLLESEPNLRFAPLVRLHWDNFLISIGDRSLAVACKMPYPGWKTFRHRPRSPPSSGIRRTRRASTVCAAACVPSPS